ncbi:hypothetical protein CcaverHIS002_0406460 [Cutaneotrichosporon cavernicola]|uniref:Uncharacterized protein n=1 Tax=Cutaneotrichosporon cavernicola TaxID=279322 RepID=A0AA48L4J6_9TREE|nr:uncharacterized protein CcaverHIS019_0406470 [Cutaneotrichosporon cavernicola]BEI84042.1 hypothetical protein CcaverHIS002_0406460 [Cutaneotrichosporon cavernicola]BEI91827.1 hypothetical protein CcaverHIS019_0406470 [Cutaneotrichosporon cavernicola]BEI99599.1 hypothetical protein CcaverHIS631_0406420 [Cutaneotrichosporon cavernicola]
MSSYGWPELHEWVPTKVPAKEPTKEPTQTTLKKDKDNKAKHHFEGREGDAKHIQGDGQWASLGELLM